MKNSMDYQDLQENLQQVDIHLDSAMDNIKHLFPDDKKGLVRLKKASELIIKVVNKYKGYFAV